MAEQEWPEVNMIRHPEDRPGGQIFGAPRPIPVFPPVTEADLEWLDWVALELGEET